MIFENCFKLHSPKDSGNFKRIFKYKCIYILNFSSCHTITYTSYLILTVQLGILRYDTGRYCNGFGRVGLSWQRRFTRQTQMIKNLLYGNVMCSLCASLQNDFVQGNQRLYSTFIQNGLASTILQTRNLPLGITGRENNALASADEECKL